MNQDDLNRAKALCEQATIGPWNQRAPGDRGDRFSIYYSDEGQDDFVAERVMQEDDAEFIAESRELVPKLLGEVSALQLQKNAAYSERNQLVAALSKLFPSSLERHPENEEWDDDWRWIVFIDMQGKQLSWHIHDSELPLFDHLERNQGRKWDGHSTEEKYERLKQIDVERLLQEY